MNTATEETLVKFTPQEQAVLAEMAKEQDLSEQGLLRQALRLYQAVHLEGKRGHRMAFVDEQGKLVPPRFAGGGAGPLE